MRRRPYNHARPASSPSTMSRDLDWLLDQWRDSSPEARQQLILAKIRQEEKEQANKPAGE